MNDDKWDLYYTPIDVAEDILRYLPKYFKPKLVVDICAGKGNFLTSSVNVLKNRQIKHYAFDINLHEDLLKNKKWTISKINSLRIGKIRQLLPLDEKKLVIANPPFGNFYDALKIAPNAKNLEELAKEANRTNRIEAKMLVSNIALMRKGDVFAAILPENIFTSERFAPFKKLFLDSFEVQHLSSPGRFFGRCEVLSRKFVGVFKEIPNGRSLTRSSKTIEVSENSIFRGLDNSLLKTKDELKGVYTREVIHFNNKNGQEFAKKCIECSRVKSRVKIEKSDILVIRVGRNAGQVVHNTIRFEGKLFSDHFLLVKNVRIKKKQVNAFQKRLDNRIKGLTIRYVTKSDINASLSGLT
jgi:hypothetical protein